VICLKIHKIKNLVNLIWIRRLIKKYLLSKSPIGVALSNAKKGQHVWIQSLPELSDNYIKKIRSKWYWKLLKLDEV
jgi:hypothetical protein